MEFSLFIVPLTYIVVELLKNVITDKKFLPHISCAIGGVLGAVFAVYYGGDVLYLIVQGIVFGASASGIYDLKENTKEAL